MPFNPRISCLSVQYNGHLCFFASFFLNYSGPIWGPVFVVELVVLYILNQFSATMKSSKQDAILIIGFQVVLVVLYGIFGVYSAHYEEKSYSSFQDVHVMIFIGFGFLMTFLKRYGYSAVGFNFLLGALIVQWALICQGFYELNESYHIEIGIDSLYKADIAAAAVLISMGAVLGRTSYIQLLVMGLVEIAVFAANAVLWTNIFQIADAGGSIIVHTFGAYFGLAVSFMLEKKSNNTETESNLEEARYTSDLFAMIGTIFLWLFWPSFNAIELSGDEQHRAIINTYLSLAACCVTAFAASLILSEHHKFDMVHVQNSTLAGGVAVGTAANLMLQPFGAILVGILAAVLSVAGYALLTPWLSAKCGLRDTCGVHNLHGMPGVLAGLVGTLMAFLASESMYRESLYEVYPAMAAKNLTATPEFSYVQPGLGRTAAAQAGYQLLALVVTMLIAIVTGLITGLVLNNSAMNPVTSENYYNDAISWTLPEPDANLKKPSTSEAHFDNPSFEPTIINGAHIEA